MTGDELLRRVAPSLRQLPWKVVFLGGSTTHLQLTDRTAPAPELTDDVDVVVEITSPVEFRVDLYERLRAIGAKEDTSEGAPLCRWIVAGLPVDVMAPGAEVLGFSNRWYPFAIASAVSRKLSDGTEIRVIGPIAFLDTKLEAYGNRGGGDCLSSKDIEDVLAVFDGRPEIATELREAPAEVREYIADSLRALATDPHFRYAVEGYLSTQPERAPLVVGRVRSMLGGR